MTWQYAKAHGTQYSPVVMLTTSGAKSGRQRTQVLPYTEWEGSYIVVGSNGGGPKDPGWVHNIRADGNVWGFTLNTGTDSLTPITGSPFHANGTLRDIVVLKP